MAKKSKTVSFHATEQTIERLDKLCKKMEISRSAVIRAAINGQYTLTFPLKEVGIGIENADVFFGRIFGTASRLSSDSRALYKVSIEDLHKSKDDPFVLQLKKMSNLENELVNALETWIETRKKKKGKSKQKPAD